MLVLGMSCAFPPAILLHMHLLSLKHNPHLLLLYVYYMGQREAEHLMLSEKDFAAILVSDNDARRANFEEETVRQSKRLTYESEYLFRVFDGYVNTYMNMTNSIGCS